MNNKEINLVADSIRLGGAILSYYPDGRLLPERQTSRNIRSLLQQCDEEGIHQNALVPTFHCMHTPGESRSENVNTSSSSFDMTQR